MSEERSRSRASGVAEGRSRRSGQAAQPRAGSLFRRQVTESLRSRSAGDIVLLPGRGSAMLAWATLLLLLAFALWVSQGTLTRRTSVQGQLEPAGGLLQLTAPESGVLQQAQAQEGQQVRRGQPLFVLGFERLGPQGQALEAEARRQIERRRDSVAEEARRVADESRQLAEQLRRQRGILQLELQRLASQKQLQQAQLAAAQETAERYQSLLEGGFVSRDELLPRVLEANEARARLVLLEREQLALQREAAALDREADDSRARLAARQAELARAETLLAQELGEADSRQARVLTAPADGRLTLVQARAGQPVSAGQVLAQLVPDGVLLQARLYVPSRATGFVQAGMPVLLRYDAFPYQQFGQHAGQVLHLAGAPLLAEGATEPLYPVLVALPAQSLQVQGQARPLRAGMGVQAELMQESRRIYEWALEPLLAWRARHAPAQAGQVQHPAAAQPAPPAQAVPALVQEAVH